MKRIVILSAMIFWGQQTIAKPRPLKVIKLPQTGKASYYSDKYIGKKTATAERYSATAFTAAHESLALGTKVKVTNLSNNKSVIVTINDRCACSRHHRIIDLSKVVAQELDFINKGVTKVKISQVN